MALGLPFKATAVLSLLRELGKMEDKPILVGGAANLVPILVKELTAGGDPTAVRTGGPSGEVEALVYIVGDRITKEDERALKTGRAAARQ